jgi:putative hydrolase of HD superfamily
MSNLGEVETINTVKAVIELGELAMKFGRINRTCVAHPDGTPESDSDHTVMLGWVAPALADLINKRAGYERYPLGAVAQFALVHDAVEVYAGDTPTHDITEEEYAAKRDREELAARRISVKFRDRLPWFARTVKRYEAQADHVARFVRSVDKIMPKIVHVLNCGQDLLRAGTGEEQFRRMYLRQRKQIEGWCAEPVLLQVYDELCGEVLRHLQNTPEHVFAVGEDGLYYLEHPNSCAGDCPVSEAFSKFIQIVGDQSLIPGRYPIISDDLGLIQFVGKQED